jgi:hypothetical protein
VPCRAYSRPTEQDAIDARELLDIDRSRPLERAFFSDDADRALIGRHRGSTTASGSPCSLSYPGFDGDF